MTNEQNEIIPIKRDIKDFLIKKSFNPITKSKKANKIQQIF